MIEQFTKLEDIQLPLKWSDDDYMHAIEEIDESDDDLSDAEAKFIEDQLTKIMRGSFFPTTQQKKWIYKLHTLHT